MRRDTVTARPSTLSLFVKVSFLILLPSGYVCAATPKGRGPGNIPENIPVECDASVEKGGGNSGSAPPLTQYDKHRFCVALCTSGLGGEACDGYLQGGGGKCKDRLADQLPMRPGNSTDVVASYNVRRAACPLLCANNLGEPLCQCHLLDGNLNLRKHGNSSNELHDQDDNVDFVAICNFYNLRYGYQIDGCVVGSRGVISPSNVIDWEGWCIERCSEGDGGVACNCDLLPLLLAARPKKH